jgi:hypothetical protein
MWGMSLRSSLLTYAAALVVLAITPPALAKGTESFNEEPAGAVPETPTVHTGHTDGARRADVAVAPELALRAPERTELDAQPNPAKRWYGWQTLATDGAAIASFVLAGTTDETSVLPAVGLGAYLLGGPIVHAAHDNWGRAALSLGMRTVIPVATGGLFFAANSCGENSSNDPDSDADAWCGLGQAIAAVFGGLVGATVASALDASLLAWEPEEPTPQVAPALGVTKTSAWLGVAGRF